MIARVWAAQATPAQAPAYAEHLRMHVLPALRQVDGYLSAALLQRCAGDSVEILVVTRWESLEAVRRFAGADLEQAVVAAEAAALLTVYDDRVRHYDVVVEDGVSGRRPGLGTPR